MNKIESAEKIIEQGGDCIGVSCGNCPGNTPHENCKYSGLNSKEIVILLKNWLAENREIAMKKIQFGDEKQLDDFIVDTVLPFFKTEDITSELKNAIKNVAIDKGYVYKSPIRQKIEKAEEIWQDFNSAKGTKFTYKDIVEIFYEIIQLLKTDHPEFKKMR